MWEFLLGLVCGVLACGGLIVLALIRFGAYRPIQKARPVSHLIPRPSDPSRTNMLDHVPGS